MSRLEIMNEKIFKTLEFGKILDQLAELTITDGAKEKAKMLAPATEIFAVQQAIDQTKAMTDVIRVMGSLPVVNFADYAPAAKRLKIGADLNAEELGNILLILRIATDVKRFLADHDELDLSALDQLQEELLIPEILYRQLKNALEVDGTILDSASSKLGSIRHSFVRMEASIKQKMDSYIHGSQSKYLSEQIITIRDERYVIPVRQEYRYKFGGVVHDQSASGQTLFVEPKGVVELNNSLQEIVAQEKAEIKRILEELSKLTAGYTSEIDLTTNALTELDFLQAKARLASSMKATEPKVNEKHQINLIAARHPLIDPKKVVANDINLGIKFDTMLITGPNTGGKTITLKTLGLLQLMAQSGLFIPAHENSQVGVFTEVFADIGDEQSIEQSLSTFSSHMDNIINILGQNDENSLVLFDELGAGTDPEEGAALAIAILDSVREKHSKIAATTHYPELKLYGYDRKRTTNASMEFDLKSLSPTYNLQIGIPGHSNAFAIAERLGMPKQIVKQARGFMNSEDSDLNNMITKLNTQTKGATQAKKLYESRLAQTEKLRDDLTQALEFYHQQEKQQLDLAKQKADDIIKQAQDKSDKIITQLREARDQGATTVKDDKLISAKGALNQMRDANLAQNRVLKRAKKQQQLKAGNEVKVLSYGQFGQITRKLSDDEFEVQIGALKVKVNKRDLEKTKQSAPVNKQPERQISHTSALKRSSTSSSLDLRGKRYDDAMMDLDRYIDSVLLAGIDSATIIHGIGTGAIRQGVQSYLRSNKHVKNFGYAPEGSGGSGATIVEFK